MEEEVSDCIWFDRYAVTEMLGKGGTGRVYLAKDIRLGRMTALKILKKATEQFEEEVQVLQKQGLYMLPVIFDAWVEKDGSGIIVMEYVRGCNLKEYLTLHRQITEKQIYLWGLQLGEFLQRLHSMNPKILYRDLKPENIMVQPDGTLRLVDVGAAVRMDEEKALKGKRTGTYGYASPEQWEGDSVDERTDIYSLGSVLYDVMYAAAQTSAKPLFPADKTGISGRAGGSYVLELKGMPEGMVSVVRRCLRREKGKRYATAAAFSEAWKRYKWAGRRSFLRNMILKSAEYGMLLSAVYAAWRYSEEISDVLTGLLGYAVLKIWENILKKKSEGWEQKKSVWCRGWEE